MSNTMNEVKTQDLQALARECGATAYTNRHYPDRTALAFGPEAFAKFCAVLQSPAPQPRVVDPETSRAIDDAVKAGRIVFEPGWNAQSQGDARPVCSADGCNRREPCGFGCRDNGNFDKPQVVGDMGIPISGDAREAFEAFYKDSSVPLWKEPEGEYVYYKSEWVAFQAGAAWQASTQPRVWTPEEIEAANKRAAEYTDWYLSGGKIASTQASEPSAAPARAAEPLTFDMPTNWELSWGSDDEENPGEWRVHVRVGGRNDREWLLLGSGSTPEAAIKKARGIGIPATTPTKTQGGEA